jgi:hypothetical protein
VVDPAQHPGGLLEAVEGDTADQRPDLADRRGGLDVVTHDVADHQHGVAVGLQERVVPVAADRDPAGGRPVTDGEHQRSGCTGGDSRPCCSRSAIRWAAPARRASSSASAARREAISAVRSSVAVCGPRSDPLTRVKAPNSSPRVSSGKVATAETRSGARAARLLVGGHRDDVVVGQVRDDHGPAAGQRRGTAAGWSRPVPDHGCRCCRTGAARGSGREAAHPVLVTGAARRAVGSTVVSRHDHGGDRGS